MTVADGYLFKGDSKQRCKLARKQKICKSSSTCKLCKVVLSVVRQQNEFFCFEFELLDVQPSWFALYQ